MKRFIGKLLAFIALAALLGACTANHPLPVRGDENIFARPVQTDIFPGNVSSYSFGTFQKPENFENVERAQFNDSPRNSAKVWVKLLPDARASGMLGNMSHYFPFDVRWKLKDGREFILENIDVRSISNDYLRKNPIQLQWQREGRPRDRVGDGDAILTFEVKDDSVLLKWAVRINRTPVNQRLTPTGAATKWDVYTEEYVMTALKGNSTSNIDFNKTYESRK